MAEDVGDTLDDTFQTRVVSHVANLSESSVSPAEHENISLWHTLLFATALLTINPAQRQCRLPLLSGSIIRQWIWEGPLGSCPLLIYKDTEAAPKMGRSRMYSPDYITTPAAEDV